MNARASLWASLAIAASIGLAGCGGSSDKKEVVLTDAQKCTEGGGSFATGSCIFPVDTQRQNLETAGDDLGEALKELAGEDVTADDVKTARNMATALQTALNRAGDVPQLERNIYLGIHANALDVIEEASARVMNAQEMQNSQDAVTAARLYAGIGTAPLKASGKEGQRTAMYGSNSNANNIVVTYDSPADNDTDPEVSGGQVLKEASMSIDDNHGWEGKKYTASGDGVTGTYEAIVYSDIEKPKEGAKFNSGNSGEGNVGFALDSGSKDTIIITTALNLAPRIASSDFDHKVGSKLFKLPEDNVEGKTVVSIDGSYYGVSGMYLCTPNNGECRVERKKDGYTLGVGTWKFKASNPEARVMQMDDTIYASYGWWLHMSEDGKIYTASAFAADKGDVPSAADITALLGKATYTGGAAGKYALSSSTGGTNDAGHFTAKAVLEANFDDDTITGTIDTFIGGDGKSRDWSVELMESTVADNGSITELKKTVWTIKDDAADAAGQWSGTLKDNGQNKVPKVATGTFHSAYGTDGNMVGAFGATVE